MILVSSSSGGHHAPTVFVVSADAELIEHLRLHFEGMGYDAAFFPSVAAIDESIRSDLPRPHAIFLDAHQTDGALAAVRSRWRDVPIILIVDEEPDDAMSLLDRGVYDFLSRPVKPARLGAVMRHAAQRRRFILAVTQLESEADRLDRFEGLTGKSPAMRTLYRTIQNAAPADVDLLITGAPGTGKRLAAQAVHRRSHRAGRPLITLDVAATPSDRINAELFGEGADPAGNGQPRRAALARADGGTLILSEVTRLPWDIQTKLLSFLQERSYTAATSGDRHTADVRVIGTTSHDPVDAVKRGWLRADLYYRLNVIPMRLPALTERADDIPMLAGEAVQRFAKKHHKPNACVMPAAMRQLMSYDWPGNVRQLHNVIEHLVALSETGTVSHDMLPVEHAMATATPGGRDRLSGHQALTGTDGPANDAATLSNGHATNEDQPSSTGLLPMLRSLASPAANDLNNPTALPSMEQLERLAIEHALRVCRSAAKAASALEISEATIYRKIKSYNLPLPRQSRAG